jgi:small subunit ribosomal protein S6
LAVNTYEGMFILDSNRYSRDPSAAPLQISSLLEKFGGEVLASRLWDDGRKLAYPISNHKKGTYWLTYFKLDGSRLGPLNRECRINEAMLRHLFIKLDPRVAPTLVSVARGEAQPRPRSESPAPTGEVKAEGAKEEIPDKDAE